MRSELLAFNMGMCDFEALGISETMQVGRIVRPYAESNGHVTDDVTWLQKDKIVTRKYVRFCVFMAVEDGWIIGQLTTNKKTSFL